MGLFAAVIFACLFLVSLLGKLDDLAGWREASRGWVPGSGRSLYIGIPATEAVLALALLWQPAVGLRATAAFLILLAAGILLRGRDRRGTDCGCFGTFVKSQVGPMLVLRNVGLGAVAAAASTVSESSSVSFPVFLVAAGASLLFVLAMETQRFRAVVTPVGEEAQ